VRAKYKALIKVLSMCNHIGQERGTLTLRNIKRIFVVGEKKIFGEMSQIIKLAGEANTLMNRMLMEDYEGKPFTETMQAIRSIEKKSDDVAFKVAEDITGGAVSPNILDNLLESVQTADEIIDNYYNIARELSRMSRAKSNSPQTQTKADFYSLFKNELTLAEKAISKLDKLLSSSHLTDIIELRKEVEALEEQGDEIKDTGFDKLYETTLHLDYLQFFHYSELLHKFDDILDSCEDLSDLIVSIVTSIMK
jgi:uncharacterized protein Yka (UPF0111/DUF47 family)